MNKITVFYDNTGYTLRWLRALVWAKEEFKKLGYIIEFHSISSFIPCFHIIAPPPDNKRDYMTMFSGKYDIVFLAYHSSHRGLGSISSADRCEVLQYLRNTCKKIVWLDAADSTGDCFFDVLPYVHLYLKKQCLVDLDRYCSPMYGSRLWCDYYHKKYGLEDTELEKEKQYLLDKKYMHKIGISWNVGLGDLFATKLNKLIYRKRYKPYNFCPPSMDREYDVHYRGSSSDSIIMFQRNKTIEMLKKTKNVSMPDVSQKVSLRDYVKEVRKSKAIISPFGYGEICGRDIEAFMYGCAMIKMDMSHLDTYPNWYIRDKTYISIDWNFKNFEDVMSIFSDKKGREYLLQIAKNGQDMYRKYMTTDEGKKEFAHHIIRQIVYG